MINRLLEQLGSPRRHLAFLVGLLTLVFVLTTVVAWRAQESEKRRADLAERTLAETANLALGDWSSLFQRYVGATLEGVAGVLGNPDVTLEDVAVAIRQHDICRVCETPDGIRSIFMIDAADGTVTTIGGQLNPAAAATILTRIETGAAARLHKRMKGGLYFSNIEGQADASVVVAILDDEQRVTGIRGVALSKPLIAEMLEMAFATSRLLPTAIAPDASVDQLLARTSSVDGAVLTSSANRAEGPSAEVGSPVYGLTLAVTPQPAAAQLLALGDDGSSARLTIVLLLVLIGGLLLVAALQMRREAELSRLQADFVSGVSHELRTPLAQIRMFTETLLLGRVRSDVERRRSLEIIDQEARRLAHLVENILLFSKTQSGRTRRIVAEPRNFAGEVREAVESFALLSRAQSAEMRTELQDGITVPVDRMALRQILVNLIDNALKYGPTGQRITVGAALFDDVARVWVDDEGPGIPVDERARVFDSFYRLPRETQSRISGSGIGLAVVRELARLHGGDAWAEAAPGRGARVVVQFPDAYLRSERTGDFAAAS